MIIMGSLLQEMQWNMDGLAVLVIDEVDVCDDYGGVPMYNDPFRRNHSPINDVTAAQQKLIMYAQGLNLPIFLIQYDLSFPIGIYCYNDSLAHHNKSTKPSLRVLLPPDTLMINKHSSNAFANTGLTGLLSEAKIQSIVVMGWHANICVRRTIGLEIDTVNKYGLGAIDYNLTVMSCQDVIQGEADWTMSHHSQIKFYSDL